MVDLFADGEPEQRFGVKEHVYENRHIERAGTFVEITENDSEGDERKYVPEIADMGQPEKSTGQ